jgi:hypothetical protein
MDDSQGVEEIVERIRQRAAAARSQGENGEAQEKGTTPIGQRVRRVWQLLDWYSQHPEEFHTTVTSRVVTARSIDELYAIAQRLEARLSEIQEAIAHLRAEIRRDT